MESPGNIEFISSQIVSQFLSFSRSIYFCVIFLVSPHFYAPVRSFSWSVIYFYVASMEGRWSEDERERERQRVYLIA